MSLKNLDLLKIYKMEVKQDLQNQIDDLKSKLTGNMMEDMEIRDQIHNIEMKIKGVKPEDSHFDCIGCGS